MIVHLLKLTLSLALFRAGPQDFPYSLPVTRALGLALIAASTLLLQWLIPLPLAFAAALFSTIGLAMFCQTLLRARKLEARLAQALAAHFAVQLLFTVLMMPALAEMAPFIRAVMADPALLQQVQAGKSPIPTSALASFAADLLFFWNLFVSVRIHRTSAQLGVVTGWLVTVASLMVMLSFVMFSQLLFYPLFK